MKRIFLNWLRSDLGTYYKKLPRCIFARQNYSGSWSVFWSRQNIFFCPCRAPGKTRAKKRYFAKAKIRTTPGCILTKQKYSREVCFVTSDGGREYFFSTLEFVFASIFVIRMRGEYIFASDNCHVF